MVRCTANAFSLLSLHEETDASSVAKLTSKRAQKRLQREAEQRELEMCLEQSLREVPCSAAQHHTPPDSPFQGFSDGDFSEMSDELFEQWLVAQAALPSPQHPQDVPPQAHWLGKAKAAEHLPEPSRVARSQAPTPRPTKTKHPPHPPPTHEEAFPPLPAPAPPSPIMHNAAKLCSSPLKPKSAKRSDVRVLNAAKPFGGGDWELHNLNRVSALDLEWDLRLDGMVPKTINVPDHMSNLDTNAVCKQQVWSQLERQSSWDDERASDRNCDFGTVWEMMGKAAQKHRLNSGGDASSSSSGGDGWSRSGDDGTPYWSKIAGKDWRPQVEAMVRNGWDPVPSRGKHIKFRRELLDGSVQTIMVPCTPSDSIRGICNFQADLARQDREAHRVLQEVLLED